LCALCWAFSTKLHTCWRGGVLFFFLYSQYLATKFVW
jgi:hypothetical protein